MSSNELATLIAKKFIQRKSAKAQQYVYPDRDEYRPVGTWNNGVRTELKPFMMSDIVDHVEGRATYGHYLLDEDDMVKLFAFDVELEKTGSLVELPNLNENDYNN